MLVLLSVVVFLLLLGLGVCTGVGGVGGTVCFAVLGVVGMGCSCWCCQYCWL